MLPRTSLAKSLNLNKMIVKYSYDLCLDDGGDDEVRKMMASSGAKDYFYEVAHLLGLLPTPQKLSFTALPST